MKDIFSLEPKKRIPTSKDIPLGLTHLPIFVTGSVSYGKATKDSDLDIVLCVSERYDPPEDAKESDYNKGLKWEENGTTINLIRLAPLEYCAWYRTTKMVRSLGLFKNLTKDEYVPLFQMLVQINKLCFRGSYINGKNYLEFCPNPEE